MKVIVMGCGRLGEQVALLMSFEGHDVTVIDYDSNALERLGAGFRGNMVKGIGFDRQVLIEAGIEEADAFAATSSSDNANIISARIARNTFHVPRVVARLYDPSRSDIYERLGLLTISSTSWGAERIRELLIHSDLDPVVAFGSGEVCILSLETPYQFAGQMVKHLSVPGEISVAAITRKGHAFIPLGGTELKSGDILHLNVMAESMDRLKGLLGLEKEG